MAVAYVVDCIRRDGQAVLSVPFRGSLGHYKRDAFDYVVHVCEVPSAVPVVEYPYGFTLEELVREAEVRHVGSSRRSVDGEEPESRGGDVVELGVGVGEQLVALLRRGVERHRVVHLVVRGVGDLPVGSIDR